MDEKRKGELAIAALKIVLRKKLAIRDVAKLKEEIGDIVKEPEMVAVKAGSGELLRLGKDLLGEVLEEQLRFLS